MLDSCCGNGNFHAYLAKKTSLKNLYFNDTNDKRLANVKKIFGEDVHITKDDFLSLNSKQVYDLIVANPPYAKFNNGQRVSKNHNLSRDFIRKALYLTKEGGYMLFIVPNNWMSFSDRNQLPSLLSQYQFLHLNIGGAKKWFPKVGSSFTWFLLQKSPNQQPCTIENHYIIKDTQQAKINIGVDFIPLYYSEAVRSLVNKTSNSKLPKYKIETSSYLHKHTKKHLLNTQKDEQYQYKVIHTPTQTVWSCMPHKYQEGWKVFLSLTNQYGTFIDACGMTQSIAFIRCKTKKEAEKVHRELQHPLFVFLNNITRYGNFNNIRVLQHFPCLDSVLLSEEDIALINSFNEQYHHGK